MRLCLHPSWSAHLHQDEWCCDRCGEVRSAMDVFQRRLLERAHELAVWRRWWRIYFVSPTALLPLRGPA